MTLFVRYCRKLGRTRAGATAIEYGLLLGLIAIALIGVLTIVGDSVAGLFGGITSEVTTAELIRGNCGDGAGEGSALCDNK